VAGVHLGLITSESAALVDATALLTRAGAREITSSVLQLSGDEATDRLALDGALDLMDGRRIVLALDMATLVPLLHRMMRRGDLLTTETALLSPLPTSLVAQGMPSALRDAARLAVEGTARAVGVLKDDSGGVLVDRAELTPWPDPALDGSKAANRRTMWLRAYVDDTQVCDGDAQRLTVTRVRSDLLRVQAHRPGGRFLGRARPTTVEGRALQLACDDARIVSDGIARERPRDKRTWWCEPDLWKVALPAQ
jgi:hypothetical protein